MQCVVCGADVPEGRQALGYDYCMDKDCVTMALAHRKANLRLVLMPKQGFTYVFADSDDLKHGKSSGKQ